MAETKQQKKPDTMQGDERVKAPVSAYDEAGRDPNVDQADELNEGREASDDSDENQRDESANPEDKAE
jgi:hypothetical protein